MIQSQPFRSEESRTMTVNMGTIDRFLRALIGGALIAIVFVGPQTPWGWLGVIPLVTAAVGFCPAYRLLGIKTR
jgi:hypothetical protein